MASEIWGIFTLGNTNIFVIFFNISNFLYLKLSVTLQYSPVVNEHQKRNTEEQHNQFQKILLFYFY